MGHIMEIKMFRVMNYTGKKDIGGIASVVIFSVNGWLIDPYNETAFLKSIKKGQRLTNEKRTEMSSFSYLYIKNHFSSNAVVPQIFNVYSKALIGVSHAK